MTHASAQPAAHETAVYTHGHHESVLRSHSWRTAANSAAYLLPELRAGLDVLDVGCGPGTITADLAALVAPGRVTAVDAAEDVLAKARVVAAERGLENAEFAVADVHALDFPDDGARPRRRARGPCAPRGRRCWTTSRRGPSARGDCGCGRRRTGSRSPPGATGRPGRAGRAGAPTPRGGASGRRRGRGRSPRGGASRKGGVPGGPDVPLDAAGEPGAVEGEGGGLEDGVAVEEFASGRLVVQGVDAPAETGQHGHPEPVVLDHDRVEVRGGALAAVAVAHGGGEQAAQGRPSDAPGHVARELREGPRVDRVGPGTGGGPQCGKRVVRAQRGRGQRQYGTSYGRH
ncbi:hypothetical protein STANM309S_04246 [Streptomyces tanashiensis]